MGPFPMVRDELVGENEELAHEGGVGRRCTRIATRLAE